MITSAFLLKLIIYGPIVAVIIPAINFVLFVIRESRRSTFTLSASRSDAADWRAGPPAPQIVGHAPASRPMQRQWTDGRGVTDLAHRFESNRQGDGVCATGRNSKREVAPPPREYVASNGVIVTPGMGAFHDAVVERPWKPPVHPSGHPHAEYWSYGSPHFYEHR